MISLNKHQVLVIDVIRRMWRDYVKILSKCAVTLSRYGTFSLLLSFAAIFLHKNTLLV